MTHTTAVRVTSESRTRPPFRAEHVGSFLRPKPLLEAREKFKAGEISAADLRAVENEAILQVVRFQEDLGLRSITDGEFRRRHFHTDFLVQLDGVEERGGLELKFKNASGEVSFAPPVLVVTDKVRHVRDIERRNFEISATHNIDGGTSCMSGRTGAYRTEILKSYDFLDNFKNERWGRYILNADDDNFVTRWLVAHQWKTWIQYEPECEIETTLENSYKFLYQCSRWARSNWRSNWTSLFVERHVWR